MIELLIAIGLFILASAWPFNMFIMFWVLGFALDLFRWGGILSILYLALQSILDHNAIGFVLAVVAWVMLCYAIRAVMRIIELLMELSFKIHQ